MALISIIVPCYNVELFIDRCVNSLVNQTIGIDKLEIILINDASTDATLRKLQVWEKRYPDNIMVITYEENMRQGGARNVGLQYASGEYIGFIDSDDWIEVEMYEELYKAIQDGKFDVAQCKYIRDDGVSPIENLGTGKKSYDYFVKKNGFYWAEETKSTDTPGTYGGIVTRLFKREVIYDHDVLFPEKIAYEDNYWYGIIRLYVKNTCYIDKIYYHYFTNTNSTVMKKNEAYYLERLTIETKLLDEYKKRGAFEVYYQEIMENFLQRFYMNTYHIFFTRFDVVPDVYKEMRKIIYMYFSDWVERFNRISPEIIKQLPLLKLLSEREDCSVEELREAYNQMAKGVV